MTDHAHFQCADTANIGTCLVAGQVLAAGADPVALARDYASVITSVHAKDVSDGTSCASPRAPTCPAPLRSPPGR